MNPGTAAAAPLRGRILLVEDDPDLLHVYARLLQAAGHEVATAMNGAIALERLRELPCDAVVSDVSMPSVGGLELLRAVRSDNLDVPVILLTSSASVRIAEQAIEFGAFRYLEKPVGMAQLQSLVEKALVHAHNLRQQRQLVAEARRAGEVTRANRELTTRFEAALAGLWMAYQPIVRWSTRTVYAYEALVRTREPTLRQPADLLQAGERLDRSQQLARSIRALAPTPMSGEGALLFLNLAARDLEDDALFSTDTPLAPLAGRTVLEITERAALEDIDDVRGRIARLRQLGYRIALDDMGAGYSGLSSLVTLEPDVVKLDMTLVRGVHQSSTRQRLVRSMTSLCDGLGALVVAEGVETEEERAALCELGCDYLQGNLFAEPSLPLPRVAFGMWE